MKPLSSHWADIAALQIIKNRGDKDCYVLASGITPSGMIHVGNFREVITVDLVARALRALGRHVRFIYSWDNFDTFRSVPKNLPDPESFVRYLRQPIARIPDPWGQAESFAAGRIRLFEEELKEVAISPEYRYQETLYAAGTYADRIRKALESKEVIRKILNLHRSSPLADDWLPTAVYCRQCHRDEMEQQSYQGEWSYFYHCASCHHEETFDIRHSDNLKLNWRIDWPMRWAFEGVDFEPGGKDHSSQGGSFDTGKAIIREVWGQEPPAYLQYDFVMIKGGAGKMSSSSGDLYTLGEVLDIYEPQVVRWIFANHRPNHDFAIAFDEDVIKIYEEFDRAEQLAYQPCDESRPGKWQLNRRSYELSLTDGKMEEQAPVRAGFRLLCNRIQICGGDLGRVLKRYYSESIKSPADQEKFHARASRALKWLQTFAPDEFRYTLNSNPVRPDLGDDQLRALQAIRQLIHETDLDAISTKDLNELIWEKAVRGADCDAPDMFRAVYQKLISRNQGPRLPGFLKEIGKERLLEILSE
ncbi:MAG: lysine--tRNA ligase [Deltaproteobacteria bacterium]|nr:lysine--tRNA ligase [Deltaproteobacteria bacterium]